MTSTERKTVAGETFKIAEWVEPDNAVLQGIDFADCTIYGPAVLLFPPGQSLKFRYCNFGADRAAQFWALEPGRFVVGAITMRDCTFQACWFRGIGFAGDDALKNALPAEATN